MCRTAVLLGLLTGTTWAETPEIELVRRVLDGPVVRSDLDAAALHRRAAAVGPGVLADPTVGVRHEQANGPAGASSDILAASVTLDGLGVQRVVAATAAGIRHRAGPLWDQAQRLRAVCLVRGQVTDLAAASASVAARGASQDRLDALFTTLSGLAEAGEASGYDRNLAALARAEHHLSLVDAQARVAELTSWFEVSAGVVVDRVVLGPSGAGATTSFHPELEAMELEVRAAERSQAAANLGTLPDITLEGGPRWDAMPDGSQRTAGYEIGAAVRVPLFERNRREVLARRSDAAAARAALERRRAELAAQSAAAEARIARLAEAPDSPDPEPLWDAAQLRYHAGESSLEELLQAAERVEAASVAQIEHARRLRHAELVRACAAGTLPEPFDALVRETR